MPALRPVVGVARCVAKGTSNGVAVVNVFHVKNGAGVTYDDAGIASLASNIANFYRIRFTPSMSTSWLPDTMSALDLTTDTGSFSSIAMTSASVSAGNLIPQSAAMCIGWKIARHYRGGHPRTYIGPLPTGALSSPTTLAPASVTTLQTAALGFMNDVNGLTIGGNLQHLVCVHRTQGGAELTTPLVDNITSAVIDSRIDSMRRRLGRDR